MGLSTAAKVGVITLVGLVLIGIVIVWKTDILLVGRGYQLIASFDNVEGLTIGSEVRYRGMKVGKVTKIDPGPYDIKLFTVIDPQIKIPDDSTLRVAYDGIVGMKFLEIRPGTSETMYAAPEELKGVRTAAIVDFVDIGSKNLVETKAILEQVRKFVENPAIQKSFANAIFTAEKTAVEAERLVSELRQATEGIKNITADPKFQTNVKGTIQETEKTLSSANRFFEGVGKINLRTSGGVDVGSRANAVRGDVDIVQSEKTYYRLGAGEGPTRQLSVLDFLLTNKVAPNFGYRLGVINSQLGGGMIINPTPNGSLLADIYDLNNPRPNWPKVRFGYEHQLQDYMDFLLQADDVLNSNNSNIMFGIRVKPPGEKLY
jgi:hypothetical protein